MKKIFLTFSLLFSLVSSAQLAPQDINSLPGELKNLTSAMRFWLGEKELFKTRSVTISGFSSFLNLTPISYTLLEAEKVWNVKHKVAYNYYDQAVPVSFAKMEVEQGKPLVYVQSNGYYFIEKEFDGVMKRGILSIGSNPTVYFADKDIEAGKKLVSYVRSFLKEKNIYRNAVIHRIVSGWSKVFAFLNNVADYKHQWNDLILDSRLKDISYENMFKFTKKMENLKSMKMDARKGIVLAGPPGTGKSFVGQIMISQILHGELKDKATMIVITARHLDRINEVQNIFNAAKFLSPTILFLEDIDLLGIKGRSAENPQSNTHNAIVLNEMLNNIDGIGSSEGLLIIGTTNKPNNLDGALLRSGRLGMHMTYGLPDFDTRILFFERFVLGKVEMEEGITKTSLAGRSEGLSGADIIEIISMAKGAAFEEGSWKEEKLFLTKSHWDYAFDIFHGEEKNSVESKKSYKEALGLLREY